MKEKLNLARLSQKELKTIAGGKPVCFCVCRVYPDGSSNLDNTQLVLDRGY